MLRMQAYDCLLVCGGGLGLLGERLSVAWAGVFGAGWGCEGLLGSMLLVPFPLLLMFYGLVFCESLNDVQSG